MESRWANQILEQITPKAREYEKRNVGAKKRGFIMGPIIMVIIMGILIWGQMSAPEGYNMKPIIAFIAIIFIIIMIVVLCCNKKAKTLDLTADFKKQIAKILEVVPAEKLDAELFAEPIEAFHTEDGDVVFYTESFIVNKFQMYGFDNYRIIRKTDAAQLHYAAQLDGIKRLYYYDLCDKDNKKIMGFNIETKKKALEFEAFFARAVEGIWLPSHGIMG